MVKQSKNVFLDCYALEDGQDTLSPTTKLRNSPEEQRLKIMFFFLYEASFLYIVSQDTSARKHEERNGT